jgi:hypothetical protein
MVPAEGKKIYCHNQTEKIKLLCFMACPFRVNVFIYILIVHVIILCFSFKTLLHFISLSNFSFFLLEFDLQSPVRLDKKSRIEWNSPENGKVEFSGEPLQKHIDHQFRENIFDILCSQLIKTF